MLFAPVLARSQTILVQGLAGKTATLIAKDLADLPRSTITFGNPPAAYEGATLTSVLRLVDAPSGPMLHGKPVSDYVVVTGADGFTATFSLAETDAYLHKGSVILADTAGGKVLGPHEGPWRLVIDGDLKPSRSVRNVVKIQLFAAP